MKHETDLVNSALTKKDVITILSEIDINTIDTPIVKQMLEYIKEFQDKYVDFPTVKIIEETFPGYIYEPASDNQKFYTDAYKKIQMSISIKKLLTNSAHRIDNEDPKKILEYMKTTLNDVYSTFDNASDSTLDKAMQEAYEEYVLNRDENKKVGIPTGLPELDLRSMPLMNGEFNVIFARPGVGKSWLATKMLITAWKEGYKGLYVSLEMKKKELATRMITLMTNINKSKIKAGKLTDEEREKVQKLMALILSQKNQVIIDDRFSCTVFDVEALIIKHSPEVVFIDYLSLMDATKQYRGGGEAKEKMRDISRSLKLMASKYNIPIVALHQSNRDFKDDGETLPQIRNLADSDDIGRNADKIYALHKPEDWERNMKIGTVKTRDAICDTSICEWDLDNGLIKEMYLDQTGEKSKHLSPSSQGGGEDFGGPKYVFDKKCPF